MNRRRMSHLWFLFLGALLAPTLRAETVDLLLVGGTVIDGSGEPGFTASVAIENQRIVGLFVPGTPLPEAAEMLDVSGLVVAPGFIDLHTHARADLVDPERALLGHYLQQGVSSVVIGNDGDGTASIGDRFARISGHGSGVNVGQFVGHSALRRQVMSETNRPATADEVKQMSKRLAQGLAEGGLGLSSGLFYTDANHAETKEVIGLAKVVAEYGGIYDTHIRAESSRAPGVRAAVEEAIAIGAGGGIPVHIAHIKTLGKDAWGMAPEITALIDEARERGQRVTADQYPWEASSTQLKNAVLSREWQAGGAQRWRQLLSDPATRPQLIADLATNIERRGGADSLMLVRTENPAWDGQRLGAIAASMGKSAEEAAAELLTIGTPRVISFNMQEADIVHFMQQPWVATSSDGTEGHPRRFASFPRKYHHYVRELAAITPEAFVRSASGLPADILGLDDRGYLRPNAIADVVVFDPATYRDQATYLDPEVPSTGVVHLLVNGVFAIRDRAITGSRPGTPLRR